MKQIHHQPYYRSHTARRQRTEFMWHLYGQGFTAKEIGNIYGHSAESVYQMLYKYAKRTKL